MYVPNHQNLLLMSHSNLHTPCRSSGSGSGSPIPLPTSLSTSTYMCNSAHRLC
ncbi:hypothetical protein M404DRAFT_1003139 [Pisolithus tinctorius Marx 270]|uniref:Uncharacterized protein n=1 Tax=Pisolithus tinctorius Marx 270 TaxID=870435 RepID=A0A0C3NKH6_PISTI|nr:hypothetical protein M404DRAFT_1003139 [Pisolithus tinctorius Marx 270]